MALDYLPRYSQVPATAKPIGMKVLALQKPPGDRGLTFGRSKQGGIPLGKVPGFWTCPYPGIITAVVLSTNQGGYTVKFWRSGANTIPRAHHRINKKGITIKPPATHIAIDNLGDFADDVVAPGDTFAIEIVDVMSPIPTDIAGQLVILQRAPEEV